PPLLALHPTTNLSSSRTIIPLHTFHLFSLLIPPPPRSTLFPYTTLFRSRVQSLERRLRVRQRGCDRTWHNRLLHSQDGRDHQIHRLHHNAPCVRTGPGPAGFAVRSRSNTLRWSNPWLIDCTSSRSPPPPAGSWA